MANSFLVPSIVGREALMILKSNMVAAQLFSRDPQQEFRTGLKIGDTVSFRKRPTFTVQDYAGSISIQNIAETSVQLTLEKHFDISVAVTSKEWTLSLQDFSSQVIAPAMAAFAEKIDTYLLSKVREIPSWVGDPANVANAVRDITAVGEQLDRQRVPMQGRIGIINPAFHAEMMAIPTFHQANMIADGGTALRQSTMGNRFGINWFGAAQNIQRHVAGTASLGTLAVNGAVSAGAATMNADGGTGSATLLVGDAFTVDGVVDQFGEPMYFYVTANNTATTGAWTGVTFYPAAPTGGFPNDANITVLDTHSMNFAGHPSAIGYALVPLDQPMGAARSDVVSADGVSIRVVYDYDSDAKQDVISFDLLAGAKVLDHRLGTRFVGGI